MAPAPVSAMSGTREGHARGFRLPRIALLTDTSDWAFANIARQLSVRLDGKFEIKTIPVSEYGTLVRALLAAAGADLIHFFWREHLVKLYWPEVQAELALLFGDSVRGVRRLLGGASITTSIFDHLFLEPNELRLRGDLFRALGVRYGASSRILFDIYRDRVEMPPPATLLRDGVDRALFRPTNLARLEGAGQQRELVVGWVGNSRFDGLGEDPKGIHSVIEPAIRTLRSQGYRVRLEVADRAVRFRPIAEMPRFYGGIDVYCCASIAEGTPNPVLEAMSSGVPVVSTRVGIVPEAFGPVQAEFLLPDRTPEALAGALRRLIESPPLLRVLSEENMTSVGPWDWAIRAAEYGDFFDRQILRG